ncbi:MAG: phage holin family protein [Candidatus Daviesbacteria bacterium]
MKSILRNYLVNLGALWITTQIFPALSITEGLKGLLIGALAFMAANILLVPLIKILLLPLNLLTVGIFSWLINVLAFYLLIKIIPNFQISTYYFSGLYYEGFSIPGMELSSLQVVVVAALLIGAIIHFINWLIK